MENEKIKKLHDAVTIARDNVDKALNQYEVAWNEYTDAISTTASEVDNGALCDDNAPRRNFIAMCENYVLENYALETSLPEMKLFAYVGKFKGRKSRFIVDLGTYTATLSLPGRERKTTYMANAYGRPINNTIITATMLSALADDYRINSADEPVPTLDLGQIVYVEGSAGKTKINNFTDLVLISSFACAHSKGIDIIDDNESQYIPY